MEKNKMLTAEDPELVEMTELLEPAACFRRAKRVYPLSDEGMEDLADGLSAVDVLEEELWPLVTGITAKNMEYFAHMIPETIQEGIKEGKFLSMGAFLAPSSKK